MTHSDLGGCLGVGHAKPGQVALDRGVQLDLAGFDQLHHRQGGEGLGERADKEGRLGAGRFTARTGLAKAAQVGDPVALNDRQSRAGNAQTVHLPFHIGVNGSI